MVRSSRRLAALAATGILLLSLDAEARRIRPVYLGLGMVKAPGVGFDLVGAVQVAPYLTRWPTTSALGRATRFAFVSNLVTAGLHVTGMGAMLRAGLDRSMSEEEVLTASCLTNAVTDLSVGILGLSSGIDLLVRARGEGLAGTEEGISAGWSAWVNIVMGGLGVVWFVPMVVGTVVGLDELPDEDTDAPRSASPQLRFGIGAGVVTLGGTF